MQTKTLTYLWVFLSFMLVLHVLHWFGVRHVEAKWNNVPPAPSLAALKGSGVGDAQLAYRLTGLMLQNLGDTGGRTTNLNQYNYEDLADWLFLTAELDARSDFVPYLGSFYFGGTNDPTQLPPLVDYLYEVGKNPEGEKFRWLAQAIYLARYKVGDVDKAYEMAVELSTLREDLPFWAKTMPALVKSQTGEKEAAIAILMEMLKDSAENLHPNEVNSTIALLCDSLLDETDIRRQTWCRGPY